MNHLDLVRMSIKTVTVEMTESSRLSTLMGGACNKTVALEELEPMITNAAAWAPAKGAGYDKVFMVLHFVNGESQKFRMELTTTRNDLVAYIDACMIIA